MSGSRPPARGRPPAETVRLSVSLCPASARSRYRFMASMRDRSACVERAPIPRRCYRAAAEAFINARAMADCARALGGFDASAAVMCPACAAERAPTPPTGARLIDRL